MKGEGWSLVSAEMRHERYPESFAIPDRAARESLQPGDAAKLLFDIETRADGRLVDRGVDRMWVIVTRRIEGGYAGILESDPGTADGLDLHPGMEVRFGAEHVADIGHPPRSYLAGKYGRDFLS